jgi:hypothetical protein
MIVGESLSLFGMLPPNQKSQKAASSIDAEDAVSKVIENSQYIEDFQDYLSS